MANRFDAIVIGSGVSGGFAAKELIEKGLRVLMLDRGVMVEHGQDYAYDGKPAYEVPARNIMPKGLSDSDYFIARHGYVAPSNQRFYNDDRLNPYAYDEGSKYYWIRPGAVGGKSLIWGRWSFRWSPDDFEANKREGIDGDWPIRYDDLAPWYSYVEKYIGVSGSRENLPYLPDSEFQPPMPMNIAEKWVKQQLETRFPGRKLIHTRLSNMTEDKPEQGRSKCQFRNQCANGCSFGAYFSTQAVTLPAARATGRLTLQSDAVVTNVEYDAAKKRVTGVRHVVGFGASMKHGMRRYGPWRFNIGAFGECLPYKDNRVSLHANKVDRFGVPLMRFNVKYHDNELRMMADAREQAEAMLKGAGLINVRSSEGEHVPGDSIHEMGGARMGADPTASVLNRWSQAHDAPNLYVTDGAQMASASCVNPSLTFMALTARAADHAVRQLKSA